MFVWPIGSCMHMALTMGPAFSEQVQVSEALVQQRRARLEAGMHHKHPPALQAQREWQGLQKLDLQKAWTDIRAITSCAPAGCAHLLCGAIGSKSHL